MKKPWNYLYDLLVSELSVCRGQRLSVKTEIEFCFKISEHYWKKLNLEQRRYSFETTQEAIHFARQVKPKFLSQVEFFKLLYSAELFKPADCLQKLRQFWESEIESCLRYAKEHELFFGEYTSGAAEEVDSTDLVVAKYLALQRYHAFVRLQLRAMRKIKSH